MGRTCFLVEVRVCYERPGTRSLPHAEPARVSNPDILILAMNYSTGVLNSMVSNLFPAMRETLGPYLVDKTKLIENIVDGRRLTGHSVDLVLRPRRCGKSTMLQMLK